MAKKAKAKKKPVAKKKPAAKKKPVKASAKPAVKASVKASAKPEKVKKPRTPTTWKPFLAMTIIGAILLSIGTVAISFATYLSSLYFDVELIPSDIQLYLLILSIVTIAGYVIGGVLIAVGVPLMVVKLVKDKKGQPKVKASAKPAAKATVKAKAKPKAKTAKKKK